MHKNAFFIGQPILSQLLSLIPRSVVDKLARQYKTDRYVKKFKSYDHLVTMLYCSLMRCESLRELTTGMQACMHRLNHLGIQYTPRRSTLADANCRRPAAFFEALYHQLVGMNYGILPDSLQAKRLEDRLFMIDSTTISLFVDAMKGAGSYSNAGKKKGGAKAHVLLKAKEDIARFVIISEARMSDQIIMKHIELPAHSIIVMDKAYVNSKILHKWDENEISWITRLRKQALIRVILRLPVEQESRKKGVLNDQLVRLGRSSNKSTKIQIVRLITFYDAEKQRVFKFLTNDLELSAQTIAGLYKRRWQIELMFKRLKSHNPLKYFLGNTENAIKIQIWCSLIADLLIKLVKDKVAKFKKRWSFSNIAGLIRQHLFTYIDLISFLRNPDKAILRKYSKSPPLTQLSLFDYMGV